MTSGLNFAAAAEAKHTIRQYVPTAMVGMYRSGALTSCFGGRYLCPPLICTQARRTVTEPQSALRGRLRVLHACSSRGFEVSLQGDTPLINGGQALEHFTCLSTKGADDPTSATAAGMSQLRPDAEPD